IGTPAHRAAVRAQLSASGINVEAAQAAGAYVEADAQTTLSRFVRDRAIDAGAFAEVVDELTGGPGNDREVRIFGEMVALLVANGRPDAALALEAMWTRVQQTRSFALLCAYPMRQFGGEAMATLLAEACSAHSFVVPAESYSALESDEERLRQIALLQQ